MSSGNLTVIGDIRINMNNHQVSVRCQRRQGHEPPGLGNAFAPAAHALPSAPLGSKIATVQ